MRLRVDQLGRGPHLVLLHGWGMNAAVWQTLLPQLATRFRVHLLDLPGHGGSPPAQRADLHEWASLCLEVAPAEAHWLGWSLGGQVALAAALAEPARFSGLTLIATTPRFVQAEDWPCAMPLATFRQFAGALDDDPQATLLRFLALQVRGAEHARDTLRQLRGELVQHPAASPAGLGQGLQLLLKTDLREALGRLACPTHWLFGARDTLVPDAVAERLAGLARDPRCDTIAGAGHAPLLSHPAACLDLLFGQTAVGQEG